MTAEILKFIKEKESELGHELPYIDRSHLAGICLNFMENATEKFIKGSKEHGGSIFDRDAEKELKPEIVDAYIYFETMETQRRTKNG